MTRNRNITSGAVAAACAFILSTLTMSGLASAEEPIRAGQGGIASGIGQCEPVWQPFTAGGETGVTGIIVSATTVWNGDLVVGGRFTTAGGQIVNCIARWDGEAWHPLTSGGQTGVNQQGVIALTVWNGDLVAGGYFTTAGGQVVSRIALWDGEAWHPFTSGGQTGVSLGGQVSDLKVWNGDLIVGGNFTTAGGQTVNNIARWDGSAWHPFNSGGQTGVGDSGNNEVAALEVYNGDLIAGGWFDTAGGQTVNNIARWDGTAWHPFYSGGQVGVNNTVTYGSLIEYNGDLIAGGWFTIAGGQTVNGIVRWDGEAWHPFTSDGVIGMSGDVHTLTVWNGDLIAGGNFNTAGGQTVNRVARWDLCPTTPDCPGDLTGNGTVDVSDILALFGCWGSLIPGRDCENADLTGSGSIDVSDLLQLLSHWGDCP